MNNKDLVNKMVAEINHNYRKYNDGCGGINYDLLSIEVGTKLRLVNRSDTEAPEWIWDAAVEASEIFQKNRKARQAQV